MKSYFQDVTKKGLTTFWNFAKPCNFVSDTDSLANDVTINEIVQRYSSNPSIRKIRENLNNSQTVEQFQFNSVTTSETRKLLKILTTKRLQELIKFLLNRLKYLLKCFLNHWKMLSIFPCNAKIVSASPNDKQSDDKNESEILYQLVFQTIFLKYLNLS